MADDEDLRARTLGRLATLITELRELHDELGQGPYEQPDTARSAALSTVHPVVAYLRDVMDLLVPGLEGYAENLVTDAINRAPAAKELDAQEAEELRVNATRLLRDVLIAGQLNGPVHPEAWPPALLGAILAALHETQQIDDWTDEAEDL